MNAETRKVAGYIPWLFWGLAALFYCYGFFQRVAPSVMVGDLMRDFSVSAAVLGNLSAFYFYAYASVQLPVGVLVDRFGARRVLALAALACGAGSALFGMAANIEIAYLGRLLVGLGAAFTWVGALKLVSVWFPANRFAMVSGMTLMLGMGGGIGGQAPLAAFVEMVGWRESMMFAAVLAVALAIAIYAVVRDGPGDHGEGPQPGQSGILDGLKSALARPQTWFIGAFGLFMAAPMLSFGGLWGVPYLMASHQLGRADAGLLASTMLVGWAIGAPVSGWLSDRLESRKPIMMGGALIALLTISATIYVPGIPVWILRGLLLVNGIAAGGMVVGFAAAREHNKPQAGGAALGLVNMLVMASGAIFQPLIGLLLDLFWDGTVLDGARVYDTQAYSWAFLSLPIAGIGAFVAASMVRETRCRQLVN